MSDFQKTSTLIPSQLPEWIRDDPNYETFVSFVRAYYEWMELVNTSNTSITIADTNSQGAVYASKNLLNYMDVDSTIDGFLNYFVNDFLPYFPENALISKNTAIKVARQLYQSKGTPASYQFLFRVLYNSDFDYFNTGDVTLKASAGKWYVPTSLKLKSDDPNFLTLNDPIKGSYKLFGQQSKTTATIENVVFAKNRTEVFISNVERLFQSGEFVTVVDNKNNPLYFLNGEVVSSNTVGAEILSAKILGQISQINIAKDILGNAIRGLYYRVGDPVVVYGGLDTPTGIGATAVVSEVTTGSLQRADLVSGGFGYTVSPESVVPGSTPDVAETLLGFENLEYGGSGVGKPPQAIVFSVDSSVESSIANTTIIKDTIDLRQHIKIGNTNYYFANGTFLNISTLDTFGINEYVFQGNSLAANTFSGKIKAIDTTNLILYVANTTGSLTNNSPIFDANTGISAMATHYTGDVSNTAVYYTANSYIVGETVYQGTFTSPTYSAIVTSYDKANNILKVKASGTVLTATPTAGQKIIGVSSNSRSTFNSQFTANANTKMSDAFTFVTFPTYPISSVHVVDGGGGMASAPTMYANSQYTTDVYDPTDPTNATGENIYGSLPSLGILSPIQISNTGTGYSISDTITIVGGRGIGAHANITNVSASGGITSVSYVQGKEGFSLGGYGYTLDDIPLVSVTSSNPSATGASLHIPGILGTGATFSLTTDRTGSVTLIGINNYGEDYITSPNVSLKIQDIVVSNVSSTNPPINLDTVYQGANLNTATYIAHVDSIQVLTKDIDPLKDLYNLRVYNYNSVPLANTPLRILSSNTKVTIANSIPVGYESVYPVSATIPILGFNQYGDGNAKATSKYLNGLVIGQGQYLDSSGQPSSFDVLQSENYNNFTYQITVQKEIAKYREILLNLLHPAGTKVIGRYAIKSKDSFGLHSQEAIYTGIPFYSSHGGIGASGATATITTSSARKSNNIVHFNNIAGANLANIIFANVTTICITPTHGPEIRSVVTKVDYVSNNITLQSNVWLTFANVANITANSGSNTINITSLTGSYDIINNGNYSNTSYPLMDIVYAGDTINIANNSTLTVKEVDYFNGIITTTTNLSSKASGKLSVNRTFLANSNYYSDQIQIFGPVGEIYIPQLVTQNGNLLITTQDGSILLLG